MSHTFVVFLLPKMESSKCQRLCYDFLLLGTRCHTKTSFRSDLAYVGCGNLYLYIYISYNFWGNIKLNFEFLVEFRKYFLLLTYKQLELLIREQQLLVISVQLNTPCLQAHKNYFSPKQRDCSRDSSCTLIGGHLWGSLPVLSVCVVWDSVSRSPGRPCTC